MAFGLFAVKDAVASQTAAEIRRVLKPGGQAVFTLWRETFVERLFTKANLAVGRPQEESDRFKIGKWLLIETGRDTVGAGGFEPDKVHHFRHDDVFPFVDMKGVLDTFDTPFWKGIGTGAWTEEQKSRWRGEIEKLISSEELATGGVPANAWILVAEK